MAGNFCKAALFAVAATLATVWGDGAQAASCSATQLAGDVSGFSISGGVKQCEVGASNNDNIGGGVLDVNTDGILGGDTNAWTFLTRWSLDTAPPSIDDDSVYTGVGGGHYSDYITILVGSDGQAGTFRVTEAAREVYSQIMVVFKGPAAYNYVAFMVQDVVGLSESAAYASVFQKATGQFQDISHLSFYGRTGVTVPVPAALSLMFGALGMLALIRRRRAAA